MKKLSPLSSITSHISLKFPLSSEQHIIPPPLLSKYPKFKYKPIHLINSDPIQHQIDFYQILKRHALLTNHKTYTSSYLSNVFTNLSKHKPHKSHSLHKQQSFHKTSSKTYLDQTSSMMKATITPKYTTDTLIEYKKKFEKGGFIFFKTGTTDKGVVDKQSNINKCKRIRIIEPSDEEFVMFDERLKYVKGRIFHRLKKNYPFFEGRKGKSVYGGTSWIGKEKVFKNTNPIDEGVYLRDNKKNLTLNSEIMFKRIKKSISMEQMESKRLIERFNSNNSDNKKKENCYKRGLHVCFK